MHSFYVAVGQPQGSECLISRTATEYSYCITTSDYLCGTSTAPTDLVQDMLWNAFEFDFSNAPGYLAQDIDVNRSFIYTADSKYNA